MQPRYRPHDLLFARAADGFVAAANRPDWLDDDAWTASAPLVVRRDTVAAGLVPVGARGPRRSQRCAGYLAQTAVIRSVTPEQLAAAIVRGPALDLQAAADTLPCIAALLDLAPRLQALGLDWGPAGGTGFWLASGLPVLGPDSDLDLLVRAPSPLSPALAAGLCELQGRAGCRIDIQIDTGHAGFALAEYARGGRILLKSAGGPLLVDDPWQARAAA